MRNRSLPMLSLRTLAAFSVSLAVWAANPARAGVPAASGIAVAFARVNLGDGSVSAFGGKGIKSVSTGTPGGGSLVVFFDGRFAKKLARENVVVQATADATAPDQLAVANAVVENASDQEIVVTVSAFKATTGDAADGWVFLTVYAGYPVPAP